MKYLFSEKPGGDQREISLVSGYARSRFNMTGTLYHRTNERIYARNREHSKLKLSSKGDPAIFRILRGDRKSYQKSDGKTAPRSLWQVTPDCPTNRVADVKEGQVCQYNYADHITTSPELKQTSVMINTDFKIKDGVNAFARFGGTRRDVKWIFAPIPFSSGNALGISGAKLKAYMAQSNTQLNKSFSKLKNDDFVDVKYRLLELGNRVFEVPTNQYSVLTGLAIEISETWSIDVAVGYSRSFRRDMGVSGFIRTDDLKKRLSTAFNPLASPGQRGNLTDLNYQKWMTSLSELGFVEISANGQTFELSSGPIGMAVGTQVHQELFRVDADESSKQDKVVGGAGSELEGKRRAVSSYMEFSIPLTNHVEWGLAGRYDSYSDFGQAFSPKTSLYWKVSPIIMVRSSIGHGFKAPNIDDLYKAKSVGRATFIDYVLCQNSSGSNCSPKRRKIVGWGNKNLKSEKSLSATLGAVVQPVDSLSFGIDGWYLKLENQVGIDFGDVTMAESRFGPDYIKEFGIDIDRDPVTNEIITMTTPAQNLAETETSGVDLSTEFSTHTRVGRFIFGVQHSQLFYKKSVGFPGLKKRDTLGQSELPPWRNVVSIDYAPIKRQSGLLRARTIAAHQKQLAKAGVLRQYTEFDLQYSYSGSWGGVISLGVRNVLGTFPPIDDSNPNAPGISTYLYDGNGRIGWVQYKQAF